MVIKITPNDKGSPAGKLADAELHFDGGELEGLKLVGFAVWERRTGTGRNVTFPARAYSVNGERRSFALLRPMADTASQDKVRDAILHAYADFFIFRDRSADAMLRWDIIDGGMKASFFRAEADKSLRAEWTLPAKRSKESARLLPVLT